MKPKPLTIEQRFPSKRGRDAADAVTDAMPVTATMAEHIDQWIAEYERVTGTIVFRGKQ